MKFLIYLLSASCLFAKILIVNSYNKTDQCGVPQLKGFLSKLYLNGYKRDDFDIYFLNARKLSQKEIDKKVEKIKKILSNYDIVVTFDDVAFSKIGVYAAKHNKVVFYSGINVLFKIYEKKYRLKNLKIAGVYEKIYIQEVLRVFNKIKKIKKIAFFYSEGVGEIIKNQYLMEVSDEFLDKTDFIYVHTIDDLKRKTKNIKNYTLFLPFALSLKDKDRKKSFIEFKDIYLKNIKKPDISINKILTSLGFLGFGGVDFYKMGQQLADIFLVYKKNGTLLKEKSKYYQFFFNAKRAKELKFKMPKWFIRKYVKEIIYD